MGEATYYARIKFGSVEECERISPEIKEFFYEMVRAEQFWQSNRGHGFYKDDPDVIPDLTDDDFWKLFEERFPRVTDYLKQLGNDYADKPYFGGDRLNGLAGMIDVGCCESDVDYGFRVDGKEILYFATVWHFAEWDPLENYIESKWDCIMNWLSDEYLDPFEML